MVKLNATFASPTGCRPTRLKVKRAHGAAGPVGGAGARITPVYPKRGRGRCPYPLQVMPRIHCLQLWFNLSDPDMEQEFYDSRSVLESAGLTLAEPIPDKTTILHFRHLLDRHRLGTELLATINAHLGLRVPAKHSKRQRPGDSAMPDARLRAERPNHGWALDFQFDQTADERA